MTELVESPFLPTGQPGQVLVLRADGKIRWVDADKLRPDSEDVCA